MLTKIFQLIKEKMLLSVIQREYRRLQNLSGVLPKRFFAIAQNDEKKQITPLFFKEGLGEISFAFKKLPLLFLALLILFPESAAFAADGGVTDTMKDFTEVIVLVLHFIVYLSWIVIGLMGDLLSNDLVMHPNVVPLLQLLWTIVRNLVNMTFVVVLLYIAFKTIFNVGSDGMSEIKEKLGPMLIAIVVVNFSFLGMKVLIDASSVTTNAAFSLANIFPKGKQFQQCEENGNCKMSEIYSISYNFNSTDKRKKDITRVCYKQNGEIKELIRIKTTEKDRSITKSIAGEFADFGGQTEEVKCPNENKSKMKLQNMVFVLPYDKTWANGEAIDLSGSLPEKITAEEIAKVNFVDKFRSDEGDENTKNSPEYDTTVEKAECFYYKDNKKAEVASSQAQKCTLAQYLQERKDQSLITIVKKEFTGEGLISNRTIVPLISSNLIELESLLFRTDSDDDWGPLILQILFSFVLAIALLIAFIAMFIVLLIRVAVLWIGFIICPLAVFAFFDVFGLQEKVKSGLSQVVAHAFIPAVFGLVLSLAFIFIGQLSLESVSTTVKTSDTIVLASSVLGSTHPLFHFLLQVLVIVLLWIGLFNAMRLSEIATPIIDTIDNTAKSVGKWAAKTPLYFNFLPVPGSGGKIKQDLAGAFGDTLGSIKKKMGDNNQADENLRNFKSGNLNFNISSQKGKAAEKIMKTANFDHKAGTETLAAINNPGTIKRNMQAIKTDMETAGIKINDIGKDEQLPLVMQYLEKVAADKNLKFNHDMMIAGVNKGLGHGKNVGGFGTQLNEKDVKNHSVYKAANLSNSSKANQFQSAIYDHIKQTLQTGDLKKILDNIAEENPTPTNIGDAIKIIKKKKKDLLK